MKMGTRKNSQLCLGDHCKIFPKYNRSQAGIIVIVILIILTLAAFVVFWNVYYYFVKNRVADISVNSLMIGGEIEYYLPSEFAVVQVKRKNDNVNITGLKIMFTEKDTKNSYLYETTKYPKALETKMYVIFKKDLKPMPTDGAWNFGRIESISLHYMFPNGKVSDEMDKQIVSPQNMSPEFIKKKCLYTDGDLDGYGTGACIPSSDLIEAGKSPLDGDCDDTTGDDPDLSEYPSSPSCSEEPDCNSPSYSKCAVCVHPGATELCDGVDNNCNGPGDDGVGCMALTNYNVATENYGTYSSGDSGCTPWSPATNGQVVSLPVSWNNYFYTDSIKNVTVCTKGHLIIGGTVLDCFTTGNPNLDTIKTKKTIAPVIGPDTTNPYYCTDPSNNYVVFRWTNGPLTSKVFILNNGEIRFSYSQQYSQFEAGISRGDSTYYNESNLWGHNNLKDYKFTRT